MIAQFKLFLKKNNTLKQVIHRFIYPKNDPRARWWIRNFVNPFTQYVGKNTIIRSNARLDVIPFNPFRIGDNSMIEDFAVINNNIGLVHIGDYTLIGMSNTLIGPVIIGNHVIFAQNIVLSGLNHSYEDVSIASCYQSCTTATIIVEDEVWIGANVVVTAGVTIGKHAVVAGGSVVTKNVPAYSVVAGNPARVIKQYNSMTKVWEKVKNEVEIR